MTARLLADWLLTYAVHGVVLSTVALCAGFGLAARPAVRVRLWRAALFGPVFTATFAVAAYEPNATERAVSLTAAVRPYVPARWRVRRVESLSRINTGSAPVTTLDVIDPLARASSLLVCALLGGPALIGGLVSVRRRKRAFQRLRAGPAAIDNAHVRVLDAHGVTLYRSAALDVPLALTRRRICLPDAGFNELGRAEQASVLLHEIAHVDRHDPAWAEAGRLLVALAWWQPLNRMILQRMERDAELATDMRAVERGAVPAALVAALALFASRVEAAAVAGVRLTRADSPVVERARRLLQPLPRSRAVSVAAIVAAALLIAAGAILVVPIPTTAGSVRGTTGLPGRDAGEVFVSDRDVEVRDTVPRR